MLSAASLARKVYMRQNIGVGEFARQYGGRNKRKGAVPEHFARASRGLIRHILKQVQSTRSILMILRWHELYCGAGQGDILNPQPDLSVSPSMP